jgi:hypothetical protein
MTIALSLLGARTRAGGELDWRAAALRGERPVGVEYVGLKEMFWSDVTSRKGGTKWAYSGTSWLSIGSWKICTGGARRVAAIVPVMEKTEDAQQRLLPQNDA